MRRKQKLKYPTQYQYKGAGTGGAGGARAPPALWPGGPGGTFTKVKMKEKRCPFAEKVPFWQAVPPLPLSRSGALGYLPVRIHAITAKFA